MQNNSHAGEGKPLKIAILGSAPSSVQLAPYNDPSWRIWGCSPGCWPHAKRADAWFEIHRRELQKPWFSTEYIIFMSRLPLVWVSEPWPELTNSKVIDKQAIFDHVLGEVVDRKGVRRQLKFGPYIWSSTVSFMIAMAIMEGADEIALFGVDMSAEEEWINQRQACQTLIKMAKDLGIKVTLPPESDLLRPSPPYGLCEVDPMFIKLLERKREIDGRLQAVEQAIQQASQEKLVLLGALQNLRYTMHTWVGEMDLIRQAYLQAPETVGALPVQDENAPVALPDMVTEALLTAKKARKPANGQVQVEA